MIRINLLHVAVLRVNFPVALVRSTLSMQHFPPPVLESHSHSQDVNYQNSVHSVDAESESNSTPW